MIKINDFYKNITPKRYWNDMMGGLMGAEEYLFRLENRKRHGFFPGNDIEFNKCIDRARVKIREYKKRAAFAKRFIGKGVTAYDIRMAGG